MLMHLISQFRHKPLPAIAVILFTVVISFSLGSLQRSNDEEQESYDNIYETTPIRFAVTDLYGEETSYVRGWIADTFTGTGSSEPFLAEYITQLQMKMSINILGEYDGYTLSGVTTVSTAVELDDAYGGNVVWLDGYDESIFESEELLCVLPLALYEMLEPGTTALTFEFPDTKHYQMVDNSVQYGTIARTLTIAGIYDSKKTDDTIFCPYSVMVALYSALGEERVYDSISGILKDNYRLEEFKAAAANWFAEPNSMGEKTPWGKWGHEYYLYALDIKDTVLQRVTHNYQISMVINRLSFALVFAFSAAAGFFIGFLLIRSRKREIGLMRTLGSSNARICLGFSAEQLLCVAAGILLGGALMDFNAPKQLALFALVYFVGLSAALIVFLHRNLISTMKEDE